MLLVLVLAFACSDDDPPTDPGNGNDPKNTPMVVETNLPTSYHIDDVPQHSISIVEEDGIKDGVLSYTENNNLIWEKDLANLASWDTTWTPSPQTPGEATLEGYATDKFSADPESKSFEYTIDLLEPQPDANTPTEFSADIPTFTQGKQGSLYFSTADKDTLDTITLHETRPDGSTNSFSVTPNSVDWDTTFSRTYASAGDVNWRITATDKHPQPETRSEEYTTSVLEPEQNTPTQFTADIPTFTRGEKGTLNFSVVDQDTLETITLQETRPDGSTNEFTTTLHDAEWDTTIHRTYNQTGEANWEVTATDKHPNPETTEQSYTIEILPTSQTYTLRGEVHNPALNQPATGVQLELFNPTNNRLDQTTSDAEGKATLKHTQGEEQPTNNHRITTSGLGYETQDFSIDLASENFSYDLTPTNILTNNPGWSIEPRDSILVNLSDAVDTQGVPLEELVVKNTSSNVSARQENQSTYWIRVENDAANTQENLELDVRTTTNKKTHNIPITIDPREPISYTNTNFEVQEQDTLTLDLLEYISSGVDVDSTHISTNDNRLEIIRDESSEYRLIPQDDVTGNIQLNLFASNKHGSETNTTGSLDVQGLPRITVRVENNETDQHTTGLEAHLGVYNNQGARVDTLSSNNGIFEIKNPEPNNKLTIRARYTREGEAFSYVRTDDIKPGTNNHLTRIVDFYIREQNGTIVGELQEGEPGIANPEGFRKWATEGGLDGVSRWNNNRSIQGSELGTFNYYTESQNQRGPDKLLIAEIFHAISVNQTSYLDSRVKNIMVDVYENDIAPWMGEFSPEIEVVDSLAFDAADNQFMNKPIYAPNDFPGFGVIGQLAVYGKAPNSIYGALVRMRTDGQGSDEVLEKFTSQEAMGAFGIMSATQADDWAENYQSVVYDATVVQRPTNLDGKLMRAVWETTYGPPVRDTSNVLYIEDVFGKPDY